MSFQLRLSNRKNINNTNFTSDRGIPPRRLGRVENWASNCKSAVVYNWAPCFLERTNGWSSIASATTGRCILQATTSDGSVSVRSSRFPKPNAPR